MCSEIQSTEKAEQIWVYFDQMTAHQGLGKDHRLSLPIEAKGMELGFTGWLPSATSHLPSLGGGAHGAQTKAVSVCSVGSECSRAAAAHSKTQLRSLFKICCLIDFFKKSIMLLSARLLIRSAGEVMKKPSNQ